ncbi:MAG: class I SAM-dependent methyltransferase, partial [Ktedonobacteraceae bacterium]|nr:class I SAM-dependent methyltransferase [Ktedonobacteraceae bacterium]
GTMVADRSPRHLAHRRGDYGVDAPAVPVVLGSIGVLLLIPGVLLTWVVPQPLPLLLLGIILLVCGIFMLLCAAGYLYSTRIGKFQVWAEILTQLHLHGDEHVLDLGCGRGAVLLMVASLLPNGQASGIDLWKTVDQSGNALATTQRNAAREGVTERVALYTADMQHLPFPENSFDLLLSSLAIHNIPSAAGREKALAEAVRVLKPGGRLVIVDVFHTQSYAHCLRQLGQSEVTYRRLDWRLWYGPPWIAAKLVTAHKPL